MAEAEDELSRPSDDLAVRLLRLPRHSELRHRSADRHRVAGLGFERSVPAAPEHIEEYLHHHGEPDGSSTKTRVENAIRNAAAGDFDNHEQQEKELGAAFFYESLLHHGRPGFIWQKLRDPRSYDYEKTETKFYDERLRMPKFPLNEQEIEAISTFVLGLVARPPAEKYLYRPKGAELAKVEGEKLLQKFNCTGCHIIDLPEISYATKLEEVAASELGVEDHPEGFELLMKLKPPRSGSPASRTPSRRATAPRLCPS